MTDDSETKEGAKDDAATVDDGVMVLEDGTVVLVVHVMPEQASKFSAWADGAGVPLPQFIREAAEMLCNRLALTATVEASEEIKTELEREDSTPLVLN